MALKAMNARNNIIIASVFGGLFVVLLAGVLAVKWPELLERYPVESVNSDEIDTSDWKKFSDRGGKYTLLYPKNFHDLEPLGYFTSDNSHSFGPSLVKSQNKTHLDDLMAQGVTLRVEMSEKQSSPMTDIEYLERRHKWFEQGILFDKDNNKYVYVAYGDIAYEGENEYGLSALRDLPENRVLSISLFAFNKDAIENHRATFEKIVENFTSNLEI